MEDEPTVFMAGASVRAAAQSAVRAGYRVWAADLFGDRDLHRCATRLWRLHPYPQALEAVAAVLPATGWMYTGGLENEPRLVAAVSRRHALCGNGPEALRHVRDPWALASLLRDAHLSCPTLNPQDTLCGPGRWVQKPVHGCGGAGIRVRIGSVPAPHAAVTTGTLVSGAPPPTYWQRLVPGRSYGAIFVGGRGRARLLGVTRQLIGCDWAGSHGYQYVGSVGPVRLRSEHRQTLARIGHQLAEAAGLVGLFGVDVVLHGREVWVLEVNPRFCASVEILERAMGFSAVALHLTACQRGALPDVPLPAGGRMHGKAVLYARRCLTIGPAWLRRIDRWSGHGQWPEVADIPQLGTSIAPGRPLWTIFARGRTVGSVIRGLQRRATAVFTRRRTR